MPYHLHLSVLHCGQIDHNSILFAIPLSWEGGSPQENLQLFSQVKWQLVLNLLCSDPPYSSAPRWHTGCSVSWNSREKKATVSSCPGAVCRLAPCYIQLDHNSTPTPPLKRWHHLEGTCMLGTQCSTSLQGWAVEPRGGLNSYDSNSLHGRMAPSTSCQHCYSQTVFASDSVFLYDFLLHNTIIICAKHTKLHSLWNIDVSGQHYMGEHCTALCSKKALFPFSMETI